MVHSLCILGCGGFIGSHLLERILQTTDWVVYGIDKTSEKIEHCLCNARFSFANIDVHDIDEVRPYVEKSDVVISLVALCNPSYYNTVPIEVIDINFSHPMDVVRMCAELNTWLIHFSTCEVYGKTVHHLIDGRDDLVEHPEYLEFDEDRTPMILGPISAQRWSYACAKQLFERALYAYGFERDFPYTIVRPCNFIGPRMDYIPGIDGDGVPRVIACFMDSLMRSNALKLVDGGNARRSFTYIEDAIDAMMAILRHPKQARKQIFNIGNPENEVSIATLAHMMIDVYRELEPRARDAHFRIESVSSETFYGPGYEDSDRRIPNITKARTLLGWEPKTDLQTTIKATITGFIEQYSDYLSVREAS